MGRCALPVRTALVGALLLALPLPGAAAPATVERFCGYAYDLDGSRFRYTEHHAQRIEDGRWLGGTIDYVAPDGGRIGRKTLSFEAHPLIPVYRMELFGGRYVEGIESVAADHVVAFRQDLGELDRRREKVAYAAPAAADSGFHALIRRDLPSLLGGGRTRFAFIVAGALDQFRFRVGRAGDARFEGRPAVRLRAEPDTLLRWLVDPLDLTYDPANGQLLEYRGPTNLRDPLTGEGYDVRISFFAAPPADLPAAAVEGCARGSNATPVAPVAPAAPIT